jgi:hypothetical protein
VGGIIGVAKTEVMPAAEKSAAKNEMRNISRLHFETRNVAAQSWFRAERSEIGARRLCLSSVGTLAVPGG